MASRGGIFQVARMKHPFSGGAARQVLFILHGILHNEMGHFRLVLHRFQALRAQLRHAPHQHRLLRSNIKSGKHYDRHRFPRFSSHLKKRFTDERKQVSIQKRQTDRKNQPINKSINQSMHQNITPLNPIEQSINQSINPINQSNNSTNQTINQSSINQTINQSTHQSIKQSTNQSVSQSPIDQSINQ